jgi:hypothetical protein
MGLYPIDKCFITGLPVTEKPSELDAFEYSITYLGKKHDFIFASNADWEEIISGETKNILHAMLRNDQWPIEPDTHITARLIENILRLSDYPRNFQEKMNYFLALHYERGGKEYKELTFDSKDFLLAFGENQDEFDRIFSGLLSQQLISQEEGKKFKDTTTQIFKLTEAGRKHAAAIIAKRIEFGQLNFHRSKPSIRVVYVEKDKLIGKQMEQYFLDKGFTVYGTQSGITKDNAETVIQHVRNDIHSGKLTYILFIKSYRSDNDSGFSSVVSLAVETNKSVRKSSQFIYVGFIDDSPTNGQPMLTDYHNVMYDLRIVPNRKRLLISILSEWVRKNKNAKVDDSTVFSVLNLLHTQFLLSPGKPVYFALTNVKDVVESDEELLNCLDQLQNENLLSFDIQSKGENYLNEYIVTLSETVSDWISNKKKSGIPVKETSQYIFPSLNITEYEQKWLNIAYKKFLDREDFDAVLLFANYWKEFPENFNPAEIDSRLIMGGSRITLLGIWHIDPSSSLIEKCDLLITTIRNILIERTHNESNITSKEILEKESKLSPKDALLTSTLLRDIGGFMSSLNTPAQSEDLSFTINLQNGQYFDAYRKYKGLETMLGDFFMRWENKNHDRVDEQPKDNIEIQTDIGNKVLFKIPVRIKDTEIEPVIGVTDLAKEVAEIVIELPNEQGTMIGVFGRWGRGKSFFIKELWNAIRSRNNERSGFTRIDFHAWKYQDTPASWAYLYEMFSDGYNKKPGSIWHVRGHMRFFFRSCRLNIKRNGWSPILKFLFSAAAFVSVTVGFSLTKQLIPILVGIPVAFTIFITFLARLKREYGTEAVRLLKKYTTKHHFKESLGLQAEIQKELISLLNVWVPKSEVGKKKILLIVEDIDRCTEERIIENIDALRVMLENDEISSRLIVIAAIDERVLKRAIKAKYHTLVQYDIGDTDSTEFKTHLDMLTNEYLDKLFISGIKLSELSQRERKEMFAAISKRERRQQKPQSAPAIVKTEIEISEDLLRKVTKPEEVPGLLEQLAQMNVSWHSHVKNESVTIKEGELALESEFGNVQTVREIIESKTKNSQVVGDHSLTNEEIETLEYYLEDWHDATPRKLRIFYYRYLLAKNLLINRYTKLGKRNIWQRSELSRVFIEMLINYSNSHDSETLKRLRVEAQQDEGAAANDDNLRKFNVSNSDYIELLRVLELVVAY